MPTLAWIIVFGILLVIFVVRGYRDLVHFLRGGLGRSLAIARTAFREAMSQRAWLAVPIWLVGVLVVGIFVSPYRLVQDRMMLSTELLVRGQLLVVGLLILTLACRSIPQELAKQTITVTASKPINRLELVGGKLLGFVALGAVLIGIMGLLSYAILWHHGQQVQRQARLELHRQAEDYQAMRRSIEPDADLKDIAENGVLYAKDPVYPTRHVSFNGKFDPGFAVMSCLKGGSEAAVEWRFDEIPVSDRVPVLTFSFWVERVPEEIAEKANFDVKAPLKISVTGISALAPRRFRVEEELELPIDPRAQIAGLSQALRFPAGSPLVLDPAKWFELYNRGPVVIRLKFPAKGHYLYFRNEWVRLRNLTPENPGSIEERVIVAPERGKGTVVGRKFRNAYEIAGVEVGEPEVAYWHFKDVDMKKFGPGEDLRFEIQSYQEKSEVVKSHTVGLVRAMAAKPDGTKTFWPEPGEELKAGGAELLSREWLGWRQVAIQERRPTVVEVPRKLFTKEADVYLFLACGSGKGWIALGEKSGYLARDRRLFAGNVLRCEAIVLLQVVSIAGISVMASSFLSWPVACFLSMTIYLIGSVRDYLENMVRFWGRLSGTLTGYAMEGLSTVLPDFGRYKASEFIAQGELIASAKLGELFIHTILCTVFMVMLGYLFLGSRELAK